MWSLPQGGGARDPRPLIIWEGGDSITGVRVNDGEVTEHVVDIKLGEPVES